MSDSKKRILDMLESGKLTSEQAMELLSAIDKNEKERGESRSSTVGKIKYLRVIVDNPNRTGDNAPGKVDIRVPISLIRAGMKFTSLIPSDVAGRVEGALHDKGINFNLKNLKDEDIDELISALQELEVDIDGGEGKVRVYVE